MYAAPVNIVGVVAVSVREYAADYAVPRIYEGYGNYIGENRHIVLVIIAEIMLVGVALAVLRYHEVIAALDVCILRLIYTDAVIYLVYIEGHLCYIAVGCGVG